MPAASVLSRLPSRATLADLAPLRPELTDPVGYLRAALLYRRLWDGGYTMLPARRGRTLHRLAATVEREGVPGDLVDCGVWNGGSSVLLSAAAPSRNIWCFDSFEGLPEPGPLDGERGHERGGTIVGSEERVRDAFARHADPARIRIVRGWFADTFPVVAPGIDRVAVLHVDGDLYESVRLTLETFYDKVSPGGFVVADDYGGWEGAGVAVDEFRAARGIRSPLVPVDASGCYWRV